jgi:parvulin-like peptidyl-prolyl isomerase
LDKEVEHAKAQMAAEGRTLKTEQMVSIEKQILEQLINVGLLESKATAADKAGGRKAAEERFQAASAKLGSQDAFERQAKKMGTTREWVVGKWIEALTAECVLKREFKINITDQEIKKFYDENPDQFDLKESVRASHILLATLDPQTGLELAVDQKATKHKQAEALLKRARAGEDFAKLASDFSEDTVSKARGGEYTFSRGQMVPEVEAAAFALATNQISGVVTSTYGYHIIKLSAKIPAGKVEMSKVIPEIKEALTQQIIQQQFPDYIAKLRKEAAVEILDEALIPKRVTDFQPIPAPSSAAPQPKKPQG